MTTATHAFVHYHKFCNLPAVNFMLKNLYTLFLLFSLAEAYHYTGMQQNSLGGAACYLARKELKYSS